MNKEYFVASSSGVQTGPYTLDQLNELGITAGTLVWCEGMPTWAKAGEVPHLQQYFKKATPPPLPRTEPPPIQRPEPPRYTPTPQIEKQPKTSNKRNMYIWLGGLAFVLIVIGIFAIVDSNIRTANSYNPYSGGSYSGGGSSGGSSASDSRRAQVSRNIRDYVSSKISYSANPLGGISNCKIVVKNSSEYTVDRVIIKVKYIKRDGGLYTEERVICDNIAAYGERVVYAPNSTRGVTVQHGFTNIQALGSTTEYVY
jgi:hypothetical protein